jgi:hypothetical protein
LASIIQRLRRLAAPCALAAALLPQGSAAAPFVISSTDAYTGTWYTATDEIIAEGTDSDETDVPGVRISSTAEADCGGDPQSLCASFPHQSPPQIGAARTDFGLNSVYAYSLHHSVGGTVSHVDAATAFSTWSDEWTLGGNVTGAPDFMIAVRADGNWSGSGSFALQLLVVDGSMQLGDDGLPLGTIARGVMTNACDWSLNVGIDLDGCAPAGFPFPLPLAPSQVFVDVNPDGDDQGSFDHTLLVAAPWVTGRTYTVMVSLRAATGPFDGSELDADSTARVTQVLVPAGGTIVSAAGALANYNVSEVPVPAVGWLFGAALAGCAVRCRRARSCPQPPSTS